MQGNKMQSLTPTNTLSTIGQLANTHAAANTFADFASRKATNTNSAHMDALNTVSAYLAMFGVTCSGDDLSVAAECWHGVTHGLITGFMGYMLKEGYAITTINNRLSAIKTYAKLAMSAGIVSADEYIKISAIRGYSVKEARRIDSTRENTRKGAKKESANVLTNEQLKQLRTQPATAQGHRDAVMIRLMSDLGLRVGEVVSLTIEAVNLTANTITFYREKVSKQQTHRLTNGLLAAMREYITALNATGITPGALIRATVKSGRLTEGAMSRQTINQRVQTLGAAIGIDTLSPHDLRHTWATLATERGTPITALRDAGGWSSLAMPSRYIAAGEIANAGVVEE